MARLGQRARRASAGYLLRGPAVPIPLAMPDAGVVALRASEGTPADRAGLSGRSALIISVDGRRAGGHAA